MKTSSSLRRGFTLVEIMVVLAIIGMLMSIAVVSVNKLRKGAQVTGCKANLTLIDSATDIWAIKKRKPDGAEPTWEDLLPFIKDKKMPECPSGGEYELGWVGEVDEEMKKPTCTIVGHTLIEDEEGEEE